MSKLLENITFEEWIRYVFDHPASNNSLWTFDDEDEVSDYWNPMQAPEITIQFITRLFENPVEVLAPFSDKQIACGLHDLISPTGSAHVVVLSNAQVPLIERLHSIKSIYVFYKEIFLPRCSNNLLYLDERRHISNPLDSICYMWWDIIPISKYSVTIESDIAPTINAVFETLEQILDLDSDSCRESALHGLGHYRWDDPLQVDYIIDKFLADYKGIRPELADYARNAGMGHVQ